MAGGGYSNLWAINLAVPVWETKNTQSQFGVFEAHIATSAGASLPTMKRKQHSRALIASGYDGKTAPARGPICSPDIRITCKRGRELGHRRFAPASFSLRPRHGFELLFRSRLRWLY